MFKHFPICRLATAVSAELGDALRDALDAGLRWRSHGVTVS
jgi:hypothetical protein